MMIFCEKVGAGDEAPSATSKHNTMRVLRVVMLTMDEVEVEVVVCLLW
jgi:hypothetical protein